MNDFPLVPRKPSPPVFVRDRRGKPVMPTSQKRARQLLEMGRARVHKLAPFTIRLVDIDARNFDTPPLFFKVDPGVKLAGVALVPLGPSETLTEVPSEVSFAAPAWDRPQTLVASFELRPRADSVRKALYSRKIARRSRRSRNLSHRKWRSSNRKRAKG
ncbi:MAG: RRXRR domain-containing protein [Deltaproteobacteria bacterium]|jgi:hypothetical protein|nr:RRXRR domain-containing protein [Deltaproteobacteria bacterium]